MERAELRALVRATGCAEERGAFSFLCDPKAERPAILTDAAKGRTASENDGLGWLCIATGGTSGSVKFARHDEQTLAAAVAGFRAHFGVEQVNAVDVLPPYHVSGLMARVRCAATGGEHIAWDWKRLETGEVPALREGRDWMISLVPTQLQRLLTSGEAVAWLRRFRTIFLGGGPTWPDLADAAAHAGLPVALSYGMTETAAMVTALRPEEFLAGMRSCGTRLPHARVRLNAEGVVAIESASLFRGYWPDERAGQEFVTEDLGRFDATGHLHLLGRRDAVIITGGKKVQPADVEAALRASGEFIDVAVLGVPDPEWGEAVVACYLATERKPDLTRAIARLAPHERPKRFVPIANWPRNAQGKMSRAELRALTESIR